MSNKNRSDNWCVVSSEFPGLIISRKVPSCSMCSGQSSIKFPFSLKYVISIHLGYDVMGENMKTIIMIVVVGFFLVSCDPFGSDDSARPVPTPPVESLRTRVLSAAPDFSNNFTASVTLFVELKEGVNHEEIDRIIVSDPGGTTWTFNEEELQRAWNVRWNEFDLWNLYYPDMPNEIQIGTWDYTVLYRDVEFSYTFEIEALSSNYSSGSTIRSAIGTGSDSEIIGGANIIGSPPVIDSTGRLSLVYQVNDSFAQKLLIRMYDSDGFFVGSGPTNTITRTDPANYDRSLTQWTDDEDIARVDRIRLQTYSTIIMNDEYSITYANRSSEIPGVINQFAVSAGSLSSSTTERSHEIFLQKRTERTAGSASAEW